MTRHVLVGHFGPEDAFAVADDDRTRATRFDLLAGDGRLGRGIGKALAHLGGLGIHPTEMGVDVAVLAAHVHAADTRLSRTATAQDAWTREIGLVVPVSDPGAWEAALPILLRMLRFLTGDHWTIGFRPRPQGQGVLSPPPLPGIDPAEFDGVCLFSGGLDSLIGALDCLAGDEYPLFVSHAGEGAVSAPQREAFRAMTEAMTRRGVNRAIPRLRFALTFPRGLVPGVPSENSTRSRSFLFLAIATLAASGLPGPQMIRIPENGLIALNVPLDPTRLGSNSTRTTHPFYIHRWNELLGVLGVSARVANRYWNRTKGEMVAQCREPAVLRALTPLTVSCAHPSAGRWNADGRRHCGTCVPCIIRRAAIESAWGTGHDPTGYRCENLSARPLDARRAEGQQIRGFQYAVRRLADDPGLARILVYKPGPLAEDLADLDGLAGVYGRGMVEVGRLLRDVRTFSSAMPDPP